MESTHGRVMDLRTRGARYRRRRIAAAAVDDDDFAAKRERREAVADAQRFVAGDDDGAELGAGVGASGFAG
jgi:hypothetical protein